MKRIALCAFGAAALVGFAFAGPLTPPVGPVAPTMKTLDEIEPRTPIESLPYTVTQPGSYYLTGDLSTAGDGIAVDASDVTIDLMGFTITGPGFAQGTWGINIPNFTRENVTIRNGTVREFEEGIIANQTGTGFGNAYVVEDVRVLGVELNGIDLRGSNNIVRNCVVDIVDNPVQSTTGISVESGVIEGCTANGFDLGIIMISGGVVTECVTTGGDSGIFVADCLVKGCSATGASSQNLSLFGTAIAVDTHAP